MVDFAGFVQRDFDEFHRYHGPSNRIAHHSTDIRAFISWSAMDRQCLYFGPHDFPFGGGASCRPVRTSKDLLLGTGSLCNEFCTLWPQ